MHFGCRADSGPPRLKINETFELLHIIKALKKAIASNAAITCYTSSGDFYDGLPKDDLIQVVLEDVVENIDENGTLHSFGLRYSYQNPYAADPGKKDLTSGKRETLPIFKGQAGDTGAHLIIGLTELGGKYPDMSRCVLELMPGLSRSKIITNVQFIANKFMDDSNRPIYEYMVKNKKVPNKDLSKLRIRSFAEKSESLEENLNNGILKEIKFLGTPKSTDQMYITGLDEIEQVITAKVKNSHRIGIKARDLINKAREFGMSSNMKVKVDLVEDTHGRTKHRTREIDLDKQGLADQLFARQVDFKSEYDMPASYEDTNQSVLQELSSMLDKQSLWL